MILYLIPILTALTLLSAGAAIYRFHFQKQLVANRLHRVLESDGTSTPNDGLIQTSLPYIIRPVAFLAWLLPGQIYSQTLYWDLARAGFRHEEARKVFTGCRILAMVLFGLVSLLTTWYLRMSSLEIALFAILSVFIGFYTPVMVIRMMQSRRQMEITLALPDALDLLVICVEAGQGLNAALLKVGKEYEMQAKALSEELKTLNNEMLAGETRTQALRNFAMRTGVDDVRALVAVMIQSDRFGTSIAQALRVHAKSLRTRRRQRAEENARKAPVKLVFPLVFCIFPELLVVILAPGMLQLYRALAGMSQSG
jgi:tight adherence protein C